MRILIADDSQQDRLMLESVLISFGHEVVKVTDGTEAMRELSRSYFPLAILDWMMPGADGPEVCRRIRESEAGGNSYTYILIVTAKDEKEDILEALESGADDFITKPLDADFLGSRIRVGERIVNTNTSLADKNERLAYLQSQLIMHNLNLSGQLESLKKNLTGTGRQDPAVRPKATGLGSGDIHLVECLDSHGSKAYNLFKEEMASGLSGFIISRTSPEKIVERHGVKDIKVITLSKNLASGSQNLPLNFLALDPDRGDYSTMRNIQAIVELVREYMEANPGAVVLLDGIEYLFTRFQMLPTMEMLYELGEVTRILKGKIIVACYPDTLDPKVLPLLKREMNWIPSE